MSFAPTGTLAAVAGLTAPAVIWDVTDTHVPRRVGEPLPTVSPDVVEFGSDGMLVIGGRGGMAVWDLTDPARPIRTGTVPVPDDAATPVAVALPPRHDTRPIAEARNSRPRSRDEVSGATLKIP